MMHVKKSLAIVFFLTLTLTQAKGQEFCEDGSMELTKVSKNRKYEMQNK
jgi:hypothetical protein